MNDFIEAHEHIPSETDDFDDFNEMLFLAILQLRFRMPFYEMVKREDGMVDDVKMER